MRHSGSATPTGGKGDPSGGTVSVESGISDEAVEQLRKLGHRVERARGGYAAIRRYRSTGNTARCAEPAKCARTAPRWAIKQKLM